MANGILSKPIKTKNAPFWRFNFDSKLIEILSHKKSPKVREIFRSLAILGISKTSDIAEYVLRVTPSSDYGLDAESGRSIPAPKKTRLRRDYNRLINKRREKVKGKDKKITIKKFDGLISYEYVQMIGKEQKKGKKILRYFLTLKGIFLALGFEYEKYELKKIIENFSATSLYFAFVNEIMKKTSLGFVSKIFIKPLIKVVGQSYIFQKEDMRFYFSNIAEHTSHALTQEMIKIIAKRNEKILGQPLPYFEKKITRQDIKEFPNASKEDLIAMKIREQQADLDDLINEFKKTGIEIVIDNIFYYEKPKNDWYDSLVELFYKKPEQIDFYREFGYDYENELVYKVMRGLHFTYYHNIGRLAPRIPRKKLRLSKRWKRHQKYKKSNGLFS